MDRLDAIRVFVRVVESGSFSAVARELGAILDSYVGSAEARAATN